MNFMDVMLVLTFFIAVSIGFFQGMIRLLIVIAALYLSTVLASLYFAPLGEFFVRQLDTQRYIAQYLAFTLVLFIGFFFLAFAGLYTFRYAKLPGSFEYLDRIVGAVLGMVLGGLIVGMMADLLWNLMVLRGGRTINMPFFRMLGDSVSHSFVVQYFANIVLPLTFSYLDPFLPDAVNILFSVRYQ